MGAGKKFNAKKEEAGKYLSIKRYRFFIKCSVCSTQITYRTDPQNNDYELESGATRIFELKREQSKEKDEADAAAKKLEDSNDAMAAMEAKAKASRREMDSLAALETLQAEGNRKRGLGPDQIIQHLKNQDALAVPNSRSSGQVENASATAIKSALDEDEAAARAAFAEKRIKRLDDHRPISFDTGMSNIGPSTLSSQSIATSSSMNQEAKRKKGVATANLHVIPRLKKRRRVTSLPAVPREGCDGNMVSASLSAGSAVSMLGHYKSSSESDEE